MPDLKIQVLRESCEPIDSYPLSIGQQALFFLNLAAPESTAYNISCASRLRPDVDVAALGSAVREAFSRNPVLRSRYLLIDGRPWQQIRPEVDVEIHVIDASEWSAERLDRHILTVTQRPFDLEKDLLCRIFIYRQYQNGAVLLLAAHHIVLDGWSLWLCLDDINRLYKAHREGSEPSLHKLRGDYIEFVRRHNEMLAGKEGERLSAYWREQLSGDLPVLDLPTTRLRSNIGDYPGAGLALSFDRETSDRLKDLARKERTTLYTVLLASFQALLHRYTQQDIVLVGSPTACRTMADFRRTVGYFVNTLVMRGDLSENPTFREFLTQMDRTVRAALEHQDYPFAHLVEQLGVDRDPGRTPVCQASFVFQKPGNLARFGDFLDLDASGTEVEGLGLVLGPLSVVQCEDQYDLALEMSEDGEKLVGLLKYRTDLFESHRVESMRSHFVNLVASLLDNPDQLISILPMLTTEEFGLTQSSGVALYSGFTSHLGLHELFARQAQRTPKAPAVIFGDDCLNFEELDSQSNRVGHGLRSLGVGPETIVGICMDRGPLMMAALLGVLKAGGAYLPLDPTYPRERIELMLRDSCVAVVLTEPDLAEVVSFDGITAICLDDDESLFQDESNADFSSGTTPENLAYLIYTSGSTGRPKGVAMPHRPLTNLIGWQLKQTVLPKGARTLQFASLSFDVSAQEIFTALCSGGTLILISEEVRHDIQRLAQFIVEERIERLFVPFVALQELAVELNKHDPNLVSLREIITAGEQLQITPAITTLFENLQDCILVNQYGPSETHVVTSYRLPENSHSWPVLPPIGRPVANTEVLLLDAHMQPVPVGVSGEIHVGGSALARGYLNQPELTATRFIQHPFKDDPQARLYKTGDFGRRRASGDIEFLGRRDSQVKVRGYRIELGEIESALRKHSAVRDTAVVLREDLQHNKRLEAYFTVVDGASVPSGREFQELLAHTLPAYMTPALFIRIDKFPLTPSGKVDRGALTALTVAPVPFDDGTDAVVKKLRTPTEELVAQTWSEVLGTAVTGGDDNFFELGGHSLMATQVVSRLTAVLGVEIPLRVIFEASTVSTLARWIDAERETGSLQGSLPPLERVQRDDGLPLSFSQERMWFLHQLAPESAAYNMGVAFRLAGCLDLEKATQSLEKIIERHENLRSTFHLRNGQPIVQIAERGSLVIGIDDLREFPLEQREREAKKRAAAEIRRPFDLSMGPLVRARLYVLGDQDQVILFCMHHIISDLWTFGVLFRELASLYTSEIGEGPWRLPIPEYQYADFASWQRRWFQGQVLENQLSYWKDRLKAVPILELPIDRPRPTLRSYNGALESLELPADFIERLRLFSTREGVTPYMTLLAAFKILMMRYTGQKDVVVGSPIANRTRVEVEEMTGTFVNTLAMRTDLSGNPSFRDLLGRVRNTTLSAYANQDLPFEKLVEELRPRREMSHSPLVQVLFNLANAPFESPNLDNLAWSPLEVDRGAAQFDLSLFVDLEITAKAYMEYNTDLLEADTVRRALGHYRNLLDALLVDPDCPILDAPLLGAEERARVLVEWNATACDYPHDVCFAQLFEARCRTRAGALAVICGDKSLTYTQLNARSNQVARRLRELGAAPGVFVGIYLDRSPDMLVATLGVLKSGAAYLPLDPGFPGERLAFMLEETQAPILITQKDLLAQAPPHRARSLVIDDDQGRIDAEDPSDLEAVAQSHDLAYVIYTSGSTGRPKGVQIPHRALVNLLESMHRKPGFGEDDILLAVTTLSFDIAALELFLPLLAGGCVVIVDQDTCHDGYRLIDRINTSKATVMQATPATWRMLIDSGWEGSPGLKILCGGEALSRDLADALLTRCHSLWNMYGPTETTIWSAIGKVGGKDPILIGRPIANTQIYLLDERSEPVPIGVPGELHIGGDGLAIGYLNRPELTAEKFIQDPFNDNPRARLYKTGDLARWRFDGTIECLGRIDNQVKIRGYRIELGEIESVLSTCPGVRENVVVARADASGHQQLIGYIMPEAERRITLAEIRPYLSQLLPSYMVPSVVVTLERIPLTPNGKIDRNALPAPDQSAIQYERPLVEARTSMERDLLHIWREVLNVDTMSIHDDFFDLGGHSLLAAQLVERIRRFFDIDLPLRSIFEDSTVAFMARRLTFSSKDGAFHYSAKPSKTGSLIPIRTSGTGKPFLIVSGTYTEEDPFLGYMANLIPHLHPDVPVFGFRARGLDGHETPHASTEQMAAAYVAELMAMQPEGPYFLGGECVGGVVAFEMAQQLIAQGKEIALLALLDTVKPSRLSSAWFHIYHLGRRMRSINQHLRNMYSSANLQDGLDYFARLIGRKRRQLLPRSEEERIRNRVERIERAYAAIIFRYRPKQYPGKLTLIVNEEQYKQNRYLGWRRLARAGIEVHSVPGNHLTRITDFVHVTGECLNGCLERARHSDKPSQDAIVRGKQ